MLTYLAVKNLTVIESASMEFGVGLNVITGETGAGKSVLVGALKFLMGERLNRAVLRDSSKPMIVEAIFNDIKALPSDLKEQYELQDELIISRQSDDAGKNKVTINGRIAPVTKLKEISEHLMDIHGQHEHQLLFDSARHLEFLDFFVKHNVKVDYNNVFLKYKEKNSELDELKKNIADTNKLKEMYEFQLEEISSFNIHIEEDSKLEETITFLSNIEKIKEATATSLDVLKMGDISVIDMLGKVEKNIANILKLAPNLDKALENITSSISYINDAVAYIEGSFEKLENGSEDLNYLIDRKFRLANLMKKYGSNISEVIAYQEKLKVNLDNVSYSDERLKRVEGEVKKIELEARKYADILNKERADVAKDISAKVVNILAELELASSKFEVRFHNQSKLDLNGGVSAEFFISTNAGFGLGSLSTVASGGEISRVMLALKEVFADIDGVDTLLFDEIDTGISGKAAKSVALKLSRLSKRKQIIVITHLPVVAAIGASHFHITKSNVDGVSKTEITKIDNKYRKEVIAMMIAGSITDAAIMQADELIKNGGI